jgi:hypothetical protein
MNSEFRTYYLRQPILEDKNLANRVLRDYYEQVTKEILLGKIYKLVGEIKMVRRIVGANKILSCKTARLREATGDPTAVVHRTNEDYHCIYWNNKKNNVFTKFKLIRRTELDIPNHRESLMFVDTITESPWKRK